MLSARFLLHSTTLTLALAFLALAAPNRLGPRVIVPQEHFEVLKMRSTMSVDPNAVMDTICIDSKANIVFHDQNAAELDICGGIAGTTAKCAGAPATTTGQSGSAKFELRAVEAGATINISKIRWEQCVRAATAVCPTGSVTGTCVGGASRGNVAFTLSKP